MKYFLSYVILFFYFLDLPSVKCQSNQSPSGVNIPSDLREAINKREMARVKGDAATWDYYTADEFSVVDETGILYSRSDRIAQLKQQQSPISLVLFTKEQFILHGNTVVHRYLLGGNWILFVWTKSGGRWRASIAQVTAAKK